ncbi:hypothetical protein PF005_g23153 [Phytophthora fragariae]|uniref:Uncharacterized protein n=1 Tax=Phytophthora fragariae TaxID=53985 RepID=A0A6A3EGB7_9STRA|nr:hypothetical protein PF009_g17449 [Phytophthora fragariae]KAE8982927.1 hypothetical protein PF011_g21408 [Phytophthora fragariae]KAE9095130.1 hypothetical protein PF007_g17495 [Phytophthora fragariae]KAE9101788.1 hypothetical protein PF010_g14336 [Phytophthora fragariae]KAE9103181.1 hypothetical protein PF006_g22251 [Phytophthora fragariae]
MRWVTIHATTIVTGGSAATIPIRHSRRQARALQAVSRQQQSLLSFSVPLGWAGCRFFSCSSSFDADITPRMLLTHCKFRTARLSLVQQCAPGEDCGTTRSSLPDVSRETKSTPRNSFAEADMARSTRVSSIDSRSRSKCCYPVREQTSNTSTNS